MLKSLLGATALGVVLGAASLSPAAAQSYPATDGPSGTASGPVPGVPGSSGPTGAGAGASGAGAPQAAGATGDASVSEIVVTGSRIPRTGLTSTSPVASTNREDIKIQEALTVEDFSARLPQLAGGVRQSAQGSDSFGAQVFDLRNFGQDRTLVLIDGTRATPFSFRNSVDVNSIPASLIKQVDVLTGGAATVYGADAVAGVVNFILNTDFKGLELNVADRTAGAGGSEYGASVTAGTNLGDRGHVVFAFDYTERELAEISTRKWAITPNATIAPIGGNFTDVKSGRTFGFTDAGQFTTAPQTSNLSSSYPLIVPLKRYNASTFFNYHLNDKVELYGRALYTHSESKESGTVGPDPIAINQTVGINQNNPFLTPQIASQLTFVNGVAQVKVNRTLAELGPITYHTERETGQVQLGLRGAFTNALKWNVYAQYGRTHEDSLITGDGLVADANGVNNFAAIANTVNIFGPNSNGLKVLGSDVDGNIRTRDQFVTSANLSGTTADVFSLPAGPIGFAVGYEYRRETAEIGQDQALLDGNTYREGSPGAYGGATTTNEFYGEVLVPLLKNLPFVKQLDAGYAYRYSQYSLFGDHNTSKVELSWAVNNSLRLRGTIQKVIRAPNFGEFAGDQSSIPFSALLTVARLKPRYAGDPCVIGTGNAAQCARFGAPAVQSTDSLTPSYLEGQYFFGGNPTIQPETGKTRTYGFVLTPDFIPRLNVTVDYFELDLRGAVGVIQPINALTNCYITNPTADNPLCALVSRDPANGHFLNAFVNDQNLGRIDQQGVDIGVSYAVPLPQGFPGRTLRFSYQGALVTRYTLQSNPTVKAVDCKGTFGATCSSDATTIVQPDYRHNVNLAWVHDRGQVQLNWQRIGGVRDSTFGSTTMIPAQNYYDLNTSYELSPALTVNAGIHNLLDKDPPFVAARSIFNTFPDTYDVLGRTFSISLTYRR